MEGYTLYEENASDGAIPDTVLAVHNSELEREEREPGYKPAFVTIRNPRKVEQERQEQEQAAALHNLETYGYGLGALVNSTATASREQAPSASTMAPPSLMPPEMRQERRQPTWMTDYSFPPLAQGRAQPTVRQSPYQWVINSGTPATVPASSLPPVSLPAAQHPPAEVSPFHHQARTEDTQSQQPKLPVTPLEANHRAHLQRLALSAIGYLESEKLQHPAVEVPRGPYPLHIQPIPGEVWRLVADIKKLSTNKKTGLPMRIELKHERFKGHFNLSSGIMQQDSPLYGYVGNTTMFSLPVWQHLVQAPKMGTANDA